MCNPIKATVVHNDHFVRHVVAVGWEIIGVILKKKVSMFSFDSQHCKYNWQIRMLVFGTSEPALVI